MRLFHRMTTKHECDAETGVLNWRYRGPAGNREAYRNRPGNPSDVAVREIISEMSRRGGRGSVLVLRE